jgi:aldehyde:ferredoxin oxidoreductase
MVSGVTGLDFSTTRLEEIANRVATLERLFNIRAGATDEDDRLPARFNEEPIRVAGKDRTIPLDVMIKMRADYYKVRGWDERGRPPDTLLQSLKIKAADKC